MSSKSWAMTQAASAGWSPPPRPHHPHRVLRNDGPEPDGLVRQPQRCRSPSPAASGRSACADFEESTGCDGAPTPTESRSRASVRGRGEPSVWCRAAIRSRSPCGLASRSPKMRISLLRLSMRQITLGIGQVHECRSGGAVSRPVGGCSSQGYLLLVGQDLSDGDGGTGDHWLITSERRIRLGHQGHGCPTRSLTSLARSPFTNPCRALPARRLPHHPTGTKTYGS